METLHTTVALIQAAHSKGCKCLQAWKSFQASTKFINYIRKIEGELDAEMQQGKFNDVNEIGTSKGNKRMSAVAPPGWEDTVKHMKEHKEITNPWALAWYQKHKGDTPHKH